MIVYETNSLCVRRQHFDFYILIFIGLALSVAHAERILYSISRDDDLLRIVNPSTGGTISSVPITLAGRIVSFGNGLATHPVTGQLFALLTLVGQPGRQLVTINPATGKLALFLFLGEISHLATNATALINERPFHFSRFKNCR